MNRERGCLRVAGSSFGKVRMVKCTKLGPAQLQTVLVLFSILIHLLKVILKQTQVILVGSKPDCIDFAYFVFCVVFYWYYQYGQANFV